MRPDQAASSLSRMNFLGHAAVARWWTRDSAAHFGAMLPDFVGMVAAAPPRVAHPEIARGVALHLATDEHFHRSREFRELAGDGVRDLMARGLGRGPALATAHVGVELIIDCALGRDAAVATDFLAAVAAGAPARLAGAVRWASPDEAARYERLHALLTKRGLAVADPEPAQLADRVLRVLAKRPRLAVSESQRAAVADFFAGAREPVVATLPGLLARLRDDLSPQFGPSGAIACADGLASGVGGS